MSLRVGGSGVTAKLHTTLTANSTMNKYMTVATIRHAVRRSHSRFSESSNAIFTIRAKAAVTTATTSVKVSKSVIDLLLWVI